MTKQEELKYHQDQVVRLEREIKAERSNEIDEITRHISALSNDINKYQHVSPIECPAIRLFKDGSGRFIDGYTDRALIGGSFNNPHDAAVLLVQGILRK